MLHSIFNQIPFCKALSRDALVALDKAAILVEHAQHTVLQLEGDPAEAMYIVVSGRVKIYRIAANGREQILQIAGAGAHFNTVALFDQGPCPANVETLTDVKLLMLPRNELLAVIEEHPMLAIALLRDICLRLRSMVDLVDKLALHSVQGRLAALLLEKAEVQERGLPVEITTQAQMAAQLGTVREMVARTLKTFEGLGLISMERGSITIVDREGLQNQCEI